MSNIKKPFFRIDAALLLLLLFVSGCFPAGGTQAGGLHVSDEARAIQIGEASYYGPAFQGRRTASGEMFDGSLLTAAHRTFGFGTILRVVNLANGKEVTVRVNDRGPARPTRILDLSTAAAREIGMLSSGVAQVRIEVLRWGL